jgi:hypothetical protein
MKRFAVALIPLLLILNTAGVAWLVLQSHKRPKRSFGLARLSVTTPTSTFSTYETKRFKSTTFANTSRLESLENDFDFLMIELLRDLK